MTLLTKLKDSEEGLIGITRNGEEVHLGVPLAFSAVHSLRTDDFNTAMKRKYEEATKFEEGLESNKDYIYFDRDRCVDCHSEDLPLRRWFNDGKFLRNWSVRFTYLYFERKKEETFQKKEDGYCPERIYGQRYIKIHRAGEKK
jgi:hypothetical protein